MIYGIITWLVGAVFFGYKDRTILTGWDRLRSLLWPFLVVFILVGHSLAILILLLHFCARKYINLQKIVLDRYYA